MIETNDRDAAETREELVDALSGAATAWAKYGLSVGRLALEAASETLGQTARVLGNLADDIERGGDGDETGLVRSPKP